MNNKINKNVVHGYSPQINSLTCGKMKEWSTCEGTHLPLHLSTCVWMCTWSVSGLSLCILNSLYWYTTRHQKFCLVVSFITFNPSEQGLQSQRHQQPGSISIPGKQDAVATKGLCLAQLLLLLNKFLRLSPEMINNAITGGEWYLLNLGSHKLFIRARKSRQPLQRVLKSCLCWIYFGLCLRFSNKGLGITASLRFYHLPLLLSEDSVFYSLVVLLLLSPSVSISSPFLTAESAFQHQVKLSHLSIN